mmetsp:Transcript_53281/g.169271  ORF Transcript_53281/g.169271 Transcript_53281/m.169271 type:complete len:185 (-) Transcript_53281:319-873(-)
MSFSAGMTSATRAPSKGASLRTSRMTSRAPAFMGARSLSPPPPFRPPHRAVRIAARRTVSVAARASDEDEYDADEDYDFFAGMEDEWDDEDEFEASYGVGGLSKISNAGNSYNFHGNKGGWSKTKSVPSTSAMAYNGSKKSKSKKALFRKDLDGETDLFGLDTLASVSNDDDDWSSGYSEYAYN